MLCHAMLCIVREPEVWSGDCYAKGCNAGGLRGQARRDRAEQGDSETASIGIDCAKADYVLPGRKECAHLDLRQATLMALMPLFAQD